MFRCLFVSVCQKELWGFKTFDERDHKLIQNQTNKFKFGICEEKFEWSRAWVLFIMMTIKVSRISCYGSTFAPVLWWKVKVLGHCRLWERNKFNPRDTPETHIFRPRGLDQKLGTNRHRPRHRHRTTQSIEFNRVLKLKNTRNFTGLNSIEKEQIFQKVRICVYIRMHKPSIYA